MPFAPKRPCTWPGCSRLTALWSKAMNEKIIRTRGFLFWGFLFAVAYLYLYEISFTITWRPTPGAVDHLFEIRNTRPIWWQTSSLFGRVLQSLSFPMQAVGLNLLPSEPYFEASVYLPFVSAVQWFLYGCIFGWWRSRVQLKKSRAESPA
jgi:hypothetical protein